MCILTRTDLSVVSITEQGQPGNHYIEHARAFLLGFSLLNVPVGLLDLPLGIFHLHDRVTGRCSHSHIDKGTEQVKEDMLSVGRY